MSRGGKRKGAGRPVGTLRGRKERITISISQKHLDYLKTSSLSYGKTIAKLIRADMSLKKTTVV